MLYPSVSVKRSLPMSTGHNSSFMVYHAEFVFVKECSAENHNKNSVSTQRNPHYGLCREHNSLMRAFSHCNKLIWMWRAVSGGCIFHKPKESWANPPTRSEVKHYMINDLRPSSCTFSLRYYAYINLLHIYLQYVDYLSSSASMWGSLSKGDYKDRLTFITSDELCFIHVFPWQCIFISWMMTILPNEPSQDDIQQWYNHL